MKEVAIISANSLIRFIRTFDDRDFNVYENFVPSIEIQSWFQNRSEVALDDVLSFIKTKGFDINEESELPNLDEFISQWNRLKGLSRGSYFRYRYATLSYLSGIHLLKLVHAGSLVDLGCGVGHFSSYYKHICDSTTAIDAEFVNLYLLNRYFSCDTKLICTNMNKSIGIEDHKEENFFISDTLHYIIDKEHFLQEISNAWNKKGIILFNHVHHCFQKNKEVGLGRPLEIDTYRRLMIEIFSHANVYSYSELGFTRYALGLDSELREAKNDEEHPVVFIISHNKIPDIQKKPLTPPNLKVNNAYNLRLEKSQLTFVRKKLPLDFMEEFYSDLYSSQIHVDYHNIQIERLFAQGLLISY